MNSIGYFEIQSSNPAREISFYKNVFGWQFFRDTFIPIEYYQIVTNTINGGLMMRPLEIPQASFGANAFVCSIQVENFDKTCQMILENGGKISIPKFTIPRRCYQGYFLDTDGNTFGIFEVDETA